MQIGLGLIYYSDKMKGVSTNVIAIILLAVGLAVVVLFLIMYGSQAQGRTFDILTMLNALKNVGG